MEPSQYERISEKCYQLIKRRIFCISQSRDQVKPSLIKIAKPMLCVTGSKLFSAGEKSSLLSNYRNPSDAFPKSRFKGNLKVRIQKVTTTIG